MFNLYTENLIEEHRRELLKEAEQHRLIAQARQNARMLQGNQQRSLTQITRNWIYASMDWSGNRLIKFGNALRKPYEEFCSQEQVKTAELCR